MSTEKLDENMTQLKDAVNEELGSEEENEELNNEELGTEEEEYSDDELIAMEKGWRPKEEFQGDPDDWRTAKQFNEFGEMKRMIKDSNARMDGMKKSHNEEISNLNLLHRRQLSDKEEDLKKQLHNAVEMGDTEQAEKIMDEQKVVTAQQAALNETVEQPESPQEAAVKQLEWENDNDWVFEDTPKARKAQAAFALARTRGMKMEETLSFVEERVAGIPNADERIPVNKNRLRPGNTTGSGQRGGGKGKQKLTINDCSSDERKYRERFPQGEAGDKAFSKTIENTRKEA
jgi:hypothetical protein